MKIIKCLLCLFISFLCLTACNNKTVADYELKLSFSITSEKYLLYDINNDKIIFKYKEDDTFYPASFAKLITLDTLLHLESDLVNNYSSYNDDQYEIIVSENLSSADLVSNKKYRLIDLAYGLVLPSGADAAYAIENYFEDKGINFIEEMNKLCRELGCTNSNFTNSTGDHDENTYTTLSDYLLVVKDLLQNETAKEILSTMEYTYNDGTEVKSTLSYIKDCEDVEVLGGKTGHTDESGRNICVYFKYEDNYYILILASSYESRVSHYEDSLKIFEMLYN